MTSSFNKVEILEQCGEFFKLRVPKQDRTIGWLFGQIEVKKAELGIQEYAVTQTSLEQIFQNFANQAIADDNAAYTFCKNKKDGRLELVNPDRRQTED